MLDPEIPLHDICNLLFDLGGVLYAIDPGRTESALHALAGPKAENLHADHPLFWALEMGDISPADFRLQLRAALDTDADDRALDAAWNALLLGPIPGRADFIREFAQQYAVCLLSNTNVIHQEVWGPQCASMFAPMQRTFFSFDMHRRKPDEQIYHEVLAEMGWAYHETLFIDDSAANIASARRVGLRTFQVDPRSPEQFINFCLKLLNKV
jgi:glucose-1-phosphatase